MEICSDISCEELDVCARALIWLASAAASASDRCRMEPGAAPELQEAEEFPSSVLFVFFFQRHGLFTFKVLQDLGRRDDTVLVCEEKAQSSFLSLSLSRRQERNEDVNPVSVALSALCSTGRRLHISAFHADYSSHELFMFPLEKLAAALFTAPLLFLFSLCETSLTVRVRVLVRVCVRRKRQRGSRFDPTAMMLG